MKNSKLYIILTILVILIFLLKILFVKDNEHFNWSWTSVFQTFPANGYLRGFNLKGVIVPIQYDYNNQANELLRLRNSGWYLCDGTFGTPDLRNKFILGGNSLNSNTIGGNETVILNKSNLPKHSHTSPFTQVPYSPRSLGPPGLFSIRANQSLHRGGKTGECNSCNGTHFSIMPPYHVLAYFMFK